MPSRHGHAGYATNIRPQSRSIAEPVHRVRCCLAVCPPCGVTLQLWNVHIRRLMADMLSGAKRPLEVLLFHKFAEAQALCGRATMHLLSAPLRPHMVIQTF